MNDSSRNPTLATSSTSTTATTTNNPNNTSLVVTTTTRSSTKNEQTSSSSTSSSSLSHPDWILITCATLGLMTATTLGSYCYYHYHQRQRQCQLDKREKQEKEDGGNRSSYSHSHNQSDIVHTPENKNSMTTPKTQGNVPQTILQNTKDDSPLNLSQQQKSQQQKSQAEMIMDVRRIQCRNTITIAYASTTGTCKEFASMLQSSIRTLLQNKQNQNQNQNQKQLIATTTTAAASKSEMESSPKVLVQTVRVEEIDWWDEFLNHDDPEPDNTHPDDIQSTTSKSTSTPPILIFILPTWTNGTLPNNAQQLLDALRELTTDWRVAPKPLRPSHLHIASFGMGSSAYDASTFCKPARDVWKLCMQLGAKSLILGSSNKNNTNTTTTTKTPPNRHKKKEVENGVIGMADDEVGDCHEVFRSWMKKVLFQIVIQSGHGSNSSSSLQKNGGKKRIVDDDGDGVSSTCCQKDGKNAKEDEGGCACNNSGSKMEEAKESTMDVQACQSGTCNHDHNEQEGHDGNDDDDDDDDDDDHSYDSYDDDDYDEEQEEKTEPELMDLEDMGNAITNTTTTNTNNKTREVKEMVTPKQAAALKKEGYKLIGTHSAVKLCRWTKHQLRGRGGCYKHTFYGITSYQCMEATPSLACANKCVFCWRHHKNPVGREWRWKTDDPNMIVEQAINTHVQMIKETKGIPGVQTDRWIEAHTVRHCALSLVGEPIMYPRIDELLADLHRRSISTFLVTNGQHPDAITSLRPITQLYVSVDAPTPESLVAIDRPLFRDAWDRLRISLHGLKEKGQRTVARLTVVKGWNSDEVEGYAKLIALGHCSLVEVKGVTFCGKSDASNLNMSNTPWHHEVVALTQKLQKELEKIRLDQIAAAAASKENNDENKQKSILPEYGLACEHRHSCSVLLARKDQFSTMDPVTGKTKWRTWIDYDKFDKLASQYAADPENFRFGVEDYAADTPEWALFGAEEEGFDPTDRRYRKKNKHPKYTGFDQEGVPLKDHDGKPIDEMERSRLRNLMDLKKREVGDGATVITSAGGEKTVNDASNMFRGLVVTK